MNSNVFIYDGDTLTHYIEGELESVMPQNDLFEDILNALDYKVISSATALELIFNDRMEGNYAVEDYFAEGNDRITLLHNGAIIVTLTKNNATVLTNSLDISLKKGVAFDESGDAFKLLSEVWIPSEA